MRFLRDGVTADIGSPAWDVAHRTGRGSATAAAFLPVCQPLRSAPACTQLVRRPYATAAVSAFLSGDLGRSCGAHQDFAATKPRTVPALLLAGADGFHADQSKRSRPSHHSAFVFGSPYDDDGDDRLSGASFPSEMDEGDPPWGRDQVPSPRVDINWSLGGGPPPPGGFGKGNDTSCSTCDCAPLGPPPANEEKLVVPNVPHHRFFTHKARKLKHRMLFFMFVGGAVLGAGILQSYRVAYMRARAKREAQQREDAEAARLAEDRYGPRPSAPRGAIPIYSDPSGEEEEPPGESAESAGDLDA